MRRRAKRRNGDGTVYRRGAGYEAAITVDGRRRTQRASTLQEGEAALRRLRALRDTGQLPKPSTVTTGEFLGRWLEHCRPSVRHSTYRRYEELLTSRAMPVLAKVPLARLSAHHLERLYADARESGLSERTVLHLHRVLHTALAAAERWDLLTANPARKVRPPRPQLVPPDVLTVSEAKRLIAAAIDHPFGPLFVLSLTTGMRQGELLGLRWQDVNLDEGQATIRQTLQRGNQGRVMGRAKNSESHRSVELPGLARDALLAHRRRQAVARLASADWHDRDLVFADERGEPLNPDRVRRRFRSFLVGLGMRPIPYKNLRHTFATIHLETGTSDVVVSKALGHSRPSTTNTFYRRVSRDHQRVAADSLQRLLSDSAAPGAGSGDVAGGVAGEGLATGETAQ